MVNLITTYNLLGCIKNVRDAGDSNRSILGYSEASILVIFINNYDFNLVFCLGYDTMNLCEYLNEIKKCFYSNESEILIKSLFNKIKDTDLILFKGSSKSRVNNILDSLKEEKLKRIIA